MIGGGKVVQQCLNATDTAFSVSCGVHGIVHAEVVFPVRRVGDGVARAGQLDEKCLGSVFLVQMVDRHTVTAKKERPMRELRSSVCAGPLPVLHNVPQRDKLVPVGRPFPETCPWVIDVAAKRVKVDGYVVLNTFCECVDGLGFGLRERGGRGGVAGGQDVAPNGGSVAVYGEVAVEVDAICICAAVCVEALVEVSLDLFASIDVPDRNHRYLDAVDRCHHEVFEEVHRDLCSNPLHRVNIRGHENPSCDGAGRIGYRECPYRSTAYCLTDGFCMNDARSFLGQIRHCVENVCISAVCSFDASWTGWCLGSLLGVLRYRWGVDGRVGSGDRYRGGGPEGCEHDADDVCDGQMFHVNLVGGRIQTRRPNVAVDTDLCLYFGVGGRNRRSLDVRLWVGQIVLEPDR